MRSVSHGVVWFSDPADQTRVLALMQDYCSARRSAYQAIQRGLKGNDVRKAVKKNYTHLGQRYVNDAVSEASKINQPHAIFGGRRAWKDMQAGKLSKEEWQARRNNTLYSRGDRTKQGNPNLRVVGDELWVNDPGKRGRWIKGKLWLHKPIEPGCYETRVQFKDGKFKVTVSWEEAVPAVKTVEGEGAVGLDVNPSGVAVVETNVEGCLLQHKFIDSGRAMFARKGKRDYDVKQLAVEVVSRAEKAGKPLILEDLKFKPKKSKDRRFNRMRHNFLHSQMVEAIESRAARQGVEVRKINPAFTSVIGELKYQEQYGGLNSHTAAALVIARKGQGLQEVVRVEPSKAGKSRVNLEGRSRQSALTSKAFSWMQHLFDVRPKPPGVTAPHLDASNPAGHTVKVQPKDCKEILPITGQAGDETFEVPF